MNKKLKTLMIAIVAIMLAPAITACEKEVIVIEKKCKEPTPEEIENWFRRSLISDKKG